MPNPRERTFKLLIYESEYREIQAWTEKYQNLETGGDLFGLWEDDCTAVVQLVVGPGEHCRRTSTSFYQDLDYLKRMGDVLTSEEGLCHIGEWHSHHTLSLMEPSGGDERTIWSNMDRYGLSRFCLFITNILYKWRWLSLSSVPDKTTVNGFLFEVDQRQRRLPVPQAEFILLQEESPFRLKYIGALREGAESLNTAEDHLRVVVQKYQQMELGLNKVLEAKQKLQTSLAAEQHARQQTNEELRSINQQFYGLKNALAALERRLDSSEQRSQKLETSLIAQTQGREELKAALAEEQKAHEETRRNTSCYWSLTRNEITLSDIMIKSGDWGHVVEGSFYDCKVAVKVIQPNILRRARLDRKFFEREMKTSIECRHPCLLQFIGATNDDQGPLFVTELPDTSLKAVLQERPLQPSDVMTIALDVAKGINYLHQKCPDPIVHGDIRSDNVLLWKKGGAGWQAKISDFCTNNILQQYMTNFPLDSIYVAPEAQTSKSPKVDVYSFGVLLWEMHIRELPDKKYKKQQIAKVPDHYEKLIKSCVKERSENRPSMKEIIDGIQFYSK